MVAEDIILAKVVINSKTKIRYWSIKSFSAITTGKECLLDVLPVKFAKVQGFVLKDIWFVIKMPRGMECVGIYSENYDRQSNKGKNILAATR